MTVINATKFNWNTVDSNGNKLLYKGCPDIAQSIEQQVSSAGSEDDVITCVTTILQNLHDFTGGILETEDYIVAWVDHIRTWALFYYQNDNEFYISQDAYEIKNKIPNAQYDDIAVTEFRMSGYVTGSETLIKDLYALNAGEFCVWNKKTKTLSKHKYFSYIPTFDSTITKQQAIQKLDRLFDDLTLKIIGRSNGRPIWIPLSGGLDSRILLCKLHEHGFRNIKTFTYGPRFNFEGFIAKRIAKKLQVPWQFVAVPKKTLKEYFDSNDRKAFWQFAGNLKTIPCMREYGAIKYLHDKGIMDKNAILLNGQSGDYITGGHLSTKSRNATTYNIDTYFDVLINKHYDLWKSLRTDNNIDLVKGRIKSLVKLITGKDLSVNSKLEGAQAEEIWEYEGRQVTYVANGQRVYEYYGYGWEMPLWEKDFVDFFEPLPFDMKYGQAIYKEYLKSYNYMGLFPEKEPYIWRWPLPMLWVVPLAQIIGLAGRKAKDNFYAFMRYWGHYSNQYSFMKLIEHIKSIGNARSVISLYITSYLEEINLRF